MHKCMRDNDCQEFSLIIKHISHIVVLGQRDLGIHEEGGALVQFWQAKFV